MTDPRVVSPAKVGISLSGGGIRSAAFSLGAIQALQLKLGLLKGQKKAALLSAVSGGSYTAAAFALVAGGVLQTPSISKLRPRDARYLETILEGHELPDGHPIGFQSEAKTDEAPNRAFRGFLLRNRRSSRSKDLKKIVETYKREGWVTSQPRDPLMPGSPEVGYIRNHARYMAEPYGMIWSGIQFISLVLINILFVIGSVAMIGISFGLINRWVGVQVFDAKESVFAYRYNLGTLVTFAITYVLFLVFMIGAFNRSTFRSESAGYFTERDVAFSEAFYALMTLAVLLILSQFVPQGIYSLALQKREGFKASEYFATLAAGVGSIGVLGPALIALVRSRIIALPKDLAKRSTRFRNMLKGITYRILQIVVALVLPLLVLTAFFGGWIYAVTAPDYSFLYFPAVVIVYAAIISFTFGGIHNITPFKFYLHKLQRCFDIIRQSRQAAEDEKSIHRSLHNLEQSANQNLTEATEERARQRVETPTLSRLREVKDIPELLICASANLSEAGTAPAGAFARPIIFSPDRIEIPGIDRARIDSAKLEELLATAYRRSSRWANASVFDGSVMSCVAVTGAAVSPTMGKFTRTWLRALMGFLNLRLGVWMPNPASGRVRQAVNHRDARDHRRLAKPAGMRYFIRELRGRHYLNSKLIYVSDGGHYENLGLVELVRRRCTEIWCIDASGDPVGSAISLAESLTIITSELGLAVDIDLSSFEVPSESVEPNYPIIKRVYAFGSIRSHDNSYTCRLNVIKIGIDSDTSPRISMLRRRYRQFPYDPTVNQLYNAERFDLYRDLGFDSTSRAIAELSRSSGGPGEVQDTGIFVGAGRRARLGVLARILHLGGNEIADAPRD